MMTTGANVPDISMALLDSVPPTAGRLGLATIPVSGPAGRQRSRQQRIQDRVPPARHRADHPATWPQAHQRPRPAALRRTPYSTSAATWPSTGNATSAYTSPSSALTCWRRSIK